MIFDKNNIEKAQPMPPIMIATVYPTVDTFTTCVAYFGRIGTSAAIAAPCNKIPGNRIRWRCVTSTICFNCAFTGLVL